MTLTLIERQNQIRELEVIKIKLISFIIILLISGFSVFSQSDVSRQYSSLLGGFKINYPQDWMASQVAFGKVLHIYFVSPRIPDRDVMMSSSIEICVQPKGYVSNSSISTSKCRQRDDHLSDSYKDRVISEETFQLNGLQIRKKITEDIYKPAATYLYASFSSKDKEFLISSVFNKRFNLDRYIPVFDQMLKTIQFLDEQKIITYRSDKYDFAIAYPNSWKSCVVSIPPQSEEEILLLVPEAKSCNSDNFISVSRMSAYSGKLMTDYQLQDLLKQKGYTTFIPFLNANSSQGEKNVADYLQTESYFFTNYLSTKDLVKIFSKIETKEKTYQNEAKEILATTQRVLSTTQ